MMKRILISLLAMAMAVSVTACASKQDGGAVKVEMASAADALNQVFAMYEEDEKFMIMGGDANHAVMEEAGQFDTSDADATLATLHVSADLAAKADDVASALHAMNANIFTGVAFHMAEGQDADAFAAELKDSVLATQWMCGFPEKLVIFTVNGEYVLYTVGAADLTENFTTKLTTLYGEAATKVVDQVVE